MNVAELMTENPQTLRADVPVADAWRALASMDVRHLPVVAADGSLVGMISDRDLARVDHDANSPDGMRPVSDIMSTPSISVTEDTDLSEVIDQLIDNKIGALPVVDVESKVVGIVSYVDVLRAYRREVS